MLKHSEPAVDARTIDGKSLLAESSQFPNSDSTGYLAGWQTPGKMSADLAVELMTGKIGAGCIRPATVASDGSIEFPAHRA